MYIINTGRNDKTAVKIILKSIYVSSTTNMYYLDFLVVAKDLFE